MSDNFQHLIIHPNVLPTMRQQWEQDILRFEAQITAIENQIDDIENDAMEPRSRQKYRISEEETQRVVAGLKLLKIEYEQKVNDRYIFLKREGWIDEED